MRSRRPLVLFLPLVLLYGLRLELAWHTRSLSTRIATASP